MRVPCGNHRDAKFVHKFDKLVPCAGQANPRPGQNYRAFCLFDLFEDAGGIPLVINDIFCLFVFFEMNQLIRVNDCGLDVKGDV